MPDPKIRGKRRDVSKILEQLAHNAEVRQLEKAEELGHILPVSETLKNEDLQAFADLEVHVYSTLESFHAPFQEFLKKIEGAAYPDFTRNRRIASLIQEIASQLSLHFVCPKC